MHAWRSSIVEVEGGIDDACVARVLCRANDDMRYVRTVSLLYSLASSSELTSSMSSVLPRRSRTSSRARSKYICPMAGDASTVADTVSICSTVTDATAPLTSSVALQLILGSRMCRRDDRDREEEEDTPPPLRLLTTAAAEGHDARREPTTLLWCAGSMRGCFRFRLIMARAWLRLCPCL